MRAPLGRATGTLGDFLAARAGIGFEKFQTILMLLGANLFYGIFLRRCLLLVELAARAGIGFEKFQTILMLLGASLFYGIFLGRCLLLVELPEDRNIIGKTLLG